MGTVIHRRYSDKADRPDLRSLAKCNNINGPICEEDRLTSDDKAVTCGRCLRIINDATASRRAFSESNLRSLSRSLGSPKEPTRDELRAMLDDARKVALSALLEPHGNIAWRILAALGVSDSEGREYIRRHRRAEGRS